MKLNKNSISILRYVISILFFYFTIHKILVLYQNGIEPFEKYVQQIGFPRFSSYYIIIALFIEIILAIGVWFQKSFILAIISGAILLFAGIILSVISLIYRFNSDCGCGLLGQNEYGILAQKLILLFILGFLYKNKKLLFIEKEPV